MKVLENLPPNLVVLNAFANRYAPNSWLRCAVLWSAHSHSPHACVCCVVMLVVGGGGGGGSIESVDAHSNVCQQLRHLGLGFNRLSSGAPLPSAGFRCSLGFLGSLSPN